MTAVCRHFGICGGCAFQDIPADAYRARKRAQVEKILASHGVEAPVAAMAEVAAGTRRRASLKASRDGGEITIGFNAERSHAIVDMQECFVLTPALLSLVQQLRELLYRLLKPGQQTEIAITETEPGFDLSLELPAKNFAYDAALLAQWARGRNVARIAVNGETAVQVASPTIRIGSAEALLPQNAFLQPTIEGERILQIAVLDIVHRARSVADLFAGCGTFTLLLAGRARVHAVDLDVEALRSLSDAARKKSGLKPVTTETRDLFKRPLRPEELNGFNAVVIDPPRAGARAQVEMIAQSRVGCLAYVSCNPETFARDAAILTKRGFHLEGVKPVDQFLWSKHIELVGDFERKQWSRRRKD